MTAGPAPERPSGGHRPGAVHRLGPVIALTDRASARAPLERIVADVAAAGIRTVVLREKDLPDAARAELAARIRDAAPGVTLISASRPVPGAAGIHLAAADPLPDARPEILGRSCHDPDELAAATAQGVDYVTCSPVFPTRSKPGHGPPLGPHGLARLIGSAGRDRPAVYALGGIGTAAQVEACMGAGADGVAVMGALMRASDPRRVATALVRAARRAHTDPPDPDRRPQHRGRRGPL